MKTAHELAKILLNGPDRKIALSLYTSTGNRMVSTKLVDVMTTDELITLFFIEPAANYPEYVIRPLNIHDHELGDDW